MSSSRCSCISLMQTQLVLRTRGVDGVIGQARVSRETIKHQKGKSLHIGSLTSTRTRPAGRVDRVSNMVCQCGGFTKTRLKRPTRTHAGPERPVLSCAQYHLPPVGRAPRVYRRLPFPQPFQLCQPYQALTALRPVATPPNFHTVGGVSPISLPIDIEDQSRRGPS